MNAAQVKLYKKFTDGTLEGLELVDRIPFPTVTAAETFADAMRGRKVVSWGSSYLVTDAVVIAQREVA